MKKNRPFAVITLVISNLFSVFYTADNAQAKEYGVSSYLIFSQQNPSKPKTKPKSTKAKPVATTPSSYHTVTTTTLNVRSRPTTSSPTVKKLKYNDKVVIIDTIDAKWVKIQVGTITGYVFRKSLSLW